MKSKTTNPKQANLFFEVNRLENPRSIELSGHQTVELEQAVAELLMDVARKDRKERAAGNDA
jgi:hypothetical protein